MDIDCGDYSCYMFVACIDNVAVYWVYISVSDILLVNLLIACEILKNGKMTQNINNNCIIQ